MRWFTWLKQREYRWFRLDPAGALATIRLVEHLPADPGSKPNSDMATLTLSGWPYMQNFATGAYVGFNAANTAEEQIAWLRQMRPDYLLSYSETLEHLAFAAGAEPPCDSLNRLIAVAEQVTPDMRVRNEDSFHSPLHQNYGLNEIGLRGAMRGRPVSCA